MATKLVIVESPTKAHKIGDYLGKYLLPTRKEYNISTTH